MADSELFKMLFQLGGTGVLAYVLWVVARRFMDNYAEQVRLTHQEQSKRIDAVEKKNDECEEDRKQLNHKLIEVLEKQQNNNKA